MTMIPLGFETIYWPQGLKDGQFSSWVIGWGLPPNAPDGFVIQHMQLSFQNVCYCDTNEPLDDDTIWNLLGYSEPTRLDFYESWQFLNGFWQLPSSRDGWGFPMAHEFYSNATQGSILFQGNAAFFPGSDLTAFGTGWGKNGDDQGSPMSGDLLSTVQVTPATTQALALPPNDPGRRSLTVTWHPCDLSDDDPGRNTIVTTVPVNNSELA